MADFFTGYNPELENRDELANTATPFTVAYSDYSAPEEIDPRESVQFNNQADMGSCGGHGNSNCGERLEAIAERRPKFDAEKQFSRLYCYLEAQRLDGLIGRDSGSTINSGLKIAKEQGYIRESELPYRTPYPRDARNLVTNEMRQKASAFKVGSHAWLKSYDELFRYLSSGVGVAFVGSLWNDSWYPRQGVLESVNFRNGGGHAYAFLGYSKRKDTKGRNYIWRLNSHSNDHWCEVSPNVIDVMFKHNFTSIVGMSDLTTPTPRPVDFTKQSLSGA